MTLNTKPTVSLFVCMTPRTGSSYLCDALKATHFAGIPEEYYTMENISELLAMYNARDYLDAHENNYTTRHDEKWVFRRKAINEGYNWRKKCLTISKRSCT